MPPELVLEPQFLLKPTGNGHLHLLEVRWVHFSGLSYKTISCWHLRVPKVASLVRWFSKDSAFVGACQNLSHEQCNGSTVCPLNSQRKWLLRAKSQEELLAGFFVGIWLNLWTSTLCGNSFWLLAHGL